MAGLNNQSLHAQDGLLEFYEERFRKVHARKQQGAYDHGSGSVCGQPIIVGREGHMWDVIV